MPKKTPRDKREREEKERDSKITTKESPKKGLESLKHVAKACCAATLQVHATRKAT